MKQKKEVNQMLRKLIIGAIVCNFVFMLLSVISTTDNSLVAQTTTIGGTAYATVPQILELVSGGIRQIPATAPNDANPWEYPNATSFDFGTLQYNSTLGYMTGENYFTTLMVPVTSGRPYRISIEGSAISGPGNFTDNALLNIPDYQYLDELPEGTPQGAMPTDAFCGGVSSVVGSHTVYEDGGTDGESRIIRGIVAISGPTLEAVGLGYTKPINFSGGHDGSDGVGSAQPFDDWAPITADTRDGDYSCDITYTLNLI